jgi:hypothetical protein
MQTRRALNMNRPLLLVLIITGFTIRPGPAADVAFFGIIKSQEFVQTNAAAPMARPTNGFAFNAFVIASSNHVVTNATVKPSNATPLRTLLPISTNTLDSWRFEERFQTSAALDAAYPVGNIITPVRYTNTMFTVNDGARVVTLNYSLLSIVGNPATPQITNFAAAQAIDHTAPFLLGFNTSGNSTFDLVQVIITDSASNVLFSSPAPFTAGALSGASNTIVIPSYVLPPDTRLTGHLSFARPVGLETNAYPGAIGVPAVLRDTEFSLKTRPAPASPVLEILSTALPFQLRYTGESNRTYRLQATQDFITWTNLLITNLPSATFTDPAPLAYRFYRVLVGN